VASEDCAYSMLWMQVRQTNREHASEQPDFSRATDKQEGTELLLVC